jgi:hypothetical protein
MEHQHHHILRFLFVNGPTASFLFRGLGVEEN